jgi:L-threonylcarbamoyladenylate synthase
MAEIIKSTDKKAVQEAVRIFMSGGVVVYPTETSYGLGADATSNKAVKKVIALKKRAKTKKISIAFSDLKMAQKYLIITKDAERLAKAFLPGPLTLVVENRVKKKVGFRIPNNKLVRSMIKKLGKPITATSANISGEGDLYKIKDVMKIFDNKANLIIDGGNLKKRSTSTVFDVMERKILRKGPVSEKKILSVLNAYSRPT